MIDPSPYPSRPLRLFAHIARWSLGLVLAFWLLLAAAWGTLHGFIVPRIGDWRVEVERLATQALGAPVQIDAISAQSSSLFPTIQLTGVSILDPQGRTALQLHSVIATLSARSVLRLGLEQLYIQAPALDIRHLPDGQWQVAGLPLVDSSATESRALDWLFEQPELVIRQGQVRLTDEQRGMPTVAWSDVDVTLRNRHWSHVLRVDATPTSGNAERIHIVGAFRQPLLPSSLAPWERWSGQWYVSTHLQQIPALPWPASWGVHTLQGDGLARVWVDVQRGHLAGITADVALPQLQIAWQETQVQDLALRQLTGRLDARLHERGWRVSGKDFSFQLADGQRWPRSEWAVQQEGPPEQWSSTAVSLDFANLAMANQVLQALPVDAALRQTLAERAPQGELRQLQVKWQRSGTYQASGQVANLVLPPQPVANDVGTPGVEGLSAAFELNADGGKVAVGIHHGALHFPGVFEEPEIPVEMLQAQVLWRIQQGRLHVEVPQAKFANGDAQGSLQATWHMGEHAHDRLPGYLQMKGVLERADGARVYRYLPLEIPADARHYVRDSVRQGQGSQVAFEVQGNLDDMPFDRPGTGRFWIQAPVKNVVYDFVPPALRTPGELPWPALTSLNGTLVFEGASMRVEQAETGFTGHPKLRMGTVTAHIADLSEPHLMLHAEGNTELNAALGLVKQSPLASLTDHALDQAKAQGSAQIAFDLDLPIDDLDKTKVRGRVGFQNNGLQFDASTPQLQQLQGAVHFHDQGFELRNVRGQALGGSFQMEGGMASLKQGLRLQSKGTATAQGLQKDSSVPLLASIAAHASGQSAYAVEILAGQGSQTVSVRSDLRGMALNLPVPLHKTADAALGLSVMQSRNPQSIETLRVEVAERGWVHYELDAAATPAQVLRGKIVVGGAAAELALPQRGVTAHVQLPLLDVAAWQAVLQSSGASTDAAAWAEAAMWLPQQIHLDAASVLLEGRELEDVRANMAHVDGLWQGRLQAKHFAGTVQYRPAGRGDASGRLFARLTHLVIPKSETQRLNQEPEPHTSTELESLPALDIEVERLEIAGKALGKLQLKARNGQGQFGREWMLEQFDLTTPETSWRASGFWGPVAPNAPRSTHLSFLLDMESSGKLLERLGMPDVIRDGKGRLSGHIAWRGAPITPHWASMDGVVHMQVEKGQFLKAEPGIGKLLSVLSLQSLTRRMVLDFRDVFSQGFAFDFVRGDISVNHGIARTDNLQMKGLNAAVLMEGSANLADETQQLKVVVVPEINAMTASLAATALNPVIGLGTFVAQMLLRGPLMEAATRTFEITGTWSDPVVEQVRRSAITPPTSSGVRP